MMRLHPRPSLPFSFRRNVERQAILSQILFRERSNLMDRAAIDDAETSLQNMLRDFLSDKKNKVPDNIRLGRMPPRLTRYAWARSGTGRRVGRARLCSRKIKRAINRLRGFHTFLGRLFLFFRLVIRLRPCMLYRVHPPRSVSKGMRGQWSNDLRQATIEYAPPPPLERES